MPAKLIVIEGLDGSGKATQTHLLQQALQTRNYLIYTTHFPRYDLPTGKVVRAYLNGDFSPDANEINPFAASSFYMADRYVSYQTEWRQYYENDQYVILLDRYTTSNLIHQGGKIPDTNQRHAYLDWMQDCEYNKLGLPKPDLVLYLHVEPAVSRQITRDRAFKSDTQRDIHEQNQDYMTQCSHLAQDTIQYCHWTKIDCMTQDQTNILPPEQIQQKIQAIVLPWLQDQNRAANKPENH